MPLINNATIGTQRQQGDGVATVLAGILAMVVIPQDTQVTPFGERERIRILIDYQRPGVPYDVQIDDLIVVGSLLTGTVATIPASPITYKAQAVDHKSGLFELTQILATKEVQ